MFTSDDAGRTGKARKKTMTPEALAANARNAQRSTGPRTPAGKRRSSLNAIKHAAYAMTPSVVALGVFEEDADELQAFIDALVLGLNPRDAAEAAEAYAIAGCHLKLGRLDRFTAKLLEAAGTISIDTWRMVSDPEAFEREHKVDISELGLKTKPTTGGAPAATQPPADDLPADDLPADDSPADGAPAGDEPPEPPKKAPPAPARYWRGTRDQVELAEERAHLLAMIPAGHGAQLTFQDWFQIGLLIAEFKAHKPFSVLVPGLKEERDIPGLVTAAIVSEWKNHKAIATWVDWFIHVEVPRLRDVVARVHAHAVQAALHDIDHRVSRPTAALLKELALHYALFEQLKARRDDEIGDVRFVDDDPPTVAVVVEVDDDDDEEDVTVETLDGRQFIGFDGDFCETNPNPSTSGGAPRYVSGEPRVYVETVVTRAETVPEPPSSAAEPEGDAQ